MKPRQARAADGIPAISLTLLVEIPVADVVLVGLVGAFLAVGADGVEVVLAAALTGIGDHELTYQHGTDRAQAAVAADEADWAVLIRPVTVAAIEANAHTGDRMPPKSTFFFPKPRTGIVFRSLG